MTATCPVCQRRVATFLDLQGQQRIDRHFRVPGPGHPSLNHPRRCAGYGLRVVAPVPGEESAQEPSR